MQVFVIINEAGIMINACVNANNWLMKGYVIKYPSNCECECDESCHVGEYVDSNNYKWRKWLIDKLVEKWSENIDEGEMINVPLNEYKNLSGSGAVYIVLFAVFLIISITISSAFIYFHWYLKKVILRLISWHWKNKLSKI